MSYGDIFSLLQYLLLDLFLCLYLECWERNDIMYSFIWNFPSMHYCIRENLKVATVSVATDCVLFSEEVTCFVFMKLLKIFRYKSTCYWALVATFMIISI